MKRYKKNIFGHFFKFKNILIMALLSVVLTGCATSLSNTSPKLDKQKTIYIMPLTNQSNMPMAQAQAEQLLASAVAQNGLNVKVYPKHKVNDLHASMEPEKRLQEAEVWLFKQVPGYVIEGSVQEWQYKYGLDGEPAVGFSLILKNSSNEILWRGSVSRSGWGRESITQIALEAMDDILSDLDWDE